MFHVKSSPALSGVSGVAQPAAQERALGQLRGTVDPNQNRILAALPEDDYQRLAPHLEPIALPSREVLHEAETPIRWVYFPTSGIVSLVLVMGDGALAEVGMVGREGMVGVSVFLGSDKSTVRAFSQIAGHAVRVRTEVFKEELRRSPALHRLVSCHMQALFSQISQSTVCNHFHTVEQRMCRWLLMCHDSVGTDQFPLTQEFLSQMLGVRRPTVTVIAGTLQKTGLITYSRGKMTILNRAGLEAAACECYEAVAKQTEHLFSGSLRTAAV